MTTVPEGPSGVGIGSALATVSPAGPPGGNSLGRSSPRYGERIIRVILLGCAALSIVVTLGIVVALLRPAISFFQQVPIQDFLFGTRWAPRFEPPSYGVIPLITGTLWTTGIALAVAVPFGLGAALYLSEYAPDSRRRRLKPVLEILAGIPTVIFGYFALEWVTQVFLKDVLGMEISTFNVLSAGLVMGIMIIPTIASLSEDALSAVPLAIRQGSMALGANRMQTTLRVVVPAALSGLAAAIVLGISRAIGETMIVTIAAGAQAQIVTSPTQGGLTMTSFIANAALGDSRVGSLQYDTLFAVGLLLFVSTLVMNMISIRLVRKFREAY